MLDGKSIHDMYGPVNGHDHHQPKTPKKNKARKHGIGILAQNFTACIVCHCMSVQGLIYLSCKKPVSWPVVWDGKCEVVI